MLSPCPTRSILSSSLSLVRSPTVEVVALSFFYLHICFNLFRSPLHVGRIASRLVSCYYFLFFFFVYRYSQKRRHSILAVLPAMILCFHANSSKRLAKIAIVSFCITIALLTYSFVIFILMLRYLFFFFLSLLTCASMYMYIRSSCLVDWMCRLVPVHCEIVLLITDRQRRFERSSFSLALVLTQAR